MNYTGQRRELEREVEDERGTIGHVLVERDFRIPAWHRHTLVAAGIGAEGSMLTGSNHEALTVTR